MECSSSHRKLLQSLIYSAVQRCRMAESPCRLSVSLKCLQNPNSPSLRVSVSDTGVGSTLEEFLELDVLALETPAEKWDGTLLITSTGINEKVIYRYRLNLQEEISSRARLIKLAPTYKSHATFSGTEVCLCLSNEADVDGFILWMAGFIRKILILRAAMDVTRVTTPFILTLTTLLRAQILLQQNLACELLVGKTGSAGSRNVCLLHDSDDVHLSVTMPSIQRLVSGLKDYALSHGNTYDRECETCYTNRGHLKVGAGAESTVERRRAKGLVVEVVIVIARTVSDSSCWMVNCSSTQELGTSRLIGTSYEGRGLYRLESSPDRLTYLSNASARDVHCQLGYPSLQNLKKLRLEFQSIAELSCESCQLGHVRVSHPP